MVKCVQLQGWRPPHGLGMLWADLGVCRICEGQGMVFLVYDYEESVS